MNAVPPEAWQIRAATADDIGVLAPLHVRCWREAYAGLIHQEHLDGLSVEDRTRKWAGIFRDDNSRTLLAFAPDGAAAGFVSFGRIKTPVPGQSKIRPLYSGEIYAVYIAQAYWRQGLGRRLLHDAAVDLAARKHRSLCIWVLEKNHRAINFYKALGGQRCGRIEVDIGGRPYTDLCFGWRDTAALCAGLG